MTSDPTLERISKTLNHNKNGLSQNQICDSFSRNVSSLQIKAALASLLESGQIGFRKEKRNNSAGRPTIVWFALKNNF